MAHWSDKYTDEQIQIGKECETHWGIATERHGEWFLDMLNDAQKAGDRQWASHSGSGPVWVKDTSESKLDVLRIRPDFERPEKTTPKLRIYPVVRYRGWDVDIQPDDDGPEMTIQTDGSDERFVGYVHESDAKHVHTCRTIWYDTEGNQYDGGTVRAIANNGEHTRSVATHLAIWEGADDTE